MPRSASRWRIKGHTDLPVAVGFGIKTAEDAAIIRPRRRRRRCRHRALQRPGASLLMARPRNGTVPASPTLVAGLASGVNGGPGPQEVNRLLNDLNPAGRLIISATITI
jgi:hypothetical protein